MNLGDFEIMIAILVLFVLYGFAYVGFKTSIARLSGDIESVREQIKREQTDVRLDKSEVLSRISALERIVHDFIGEFRIYKKQIDRLETKIDTAINETHKNK